jgi:hypothetical protein
MDPCAEVVQEQGGGLHCVAVRRSGPGLANGNVRSSRES